MRWVWGESSPRPVEYGAVVLAHDVLSGGFWCEVHLFGLVFGARCAVFGLGFWFAVCGAPILGSILVRGAPFFGLDFGARCVVRRFWGRFWCTVRLFGFDFGARCVVRRCLGRFWCAARRFLDSILVRGVWCADFGADFGARCAFLGSILVRGVWCADSGVDFGARRAVFWTRFWCAVCGAPILVHGAIFGFDFGARCVAKCSPIPRASSSGTECDF